MPRDLHAPTEEKSRPRLNLYFITCARLAAREPTFHNENRKNCARYRRNSSCRCRFLAGTSQDLQGEDLPRSRRRLPPGNYRLRQERRLAARRRSEERRVGKEGSTRW